MKTGIYYWFGYTIDLMERFRLIGKSGFDSVIIWWGDEFKEIDGDKNDWPDMARSQGLTIDNVHAPYQYANDIWKDTLNGETIKNLYIDCIEDCKVHQISTVVLHATDGLKPPPVSEIGLNRFRQIAEHAENMEIYVALENIRHTEYLKVIFAEIESSYLGLCYDSGHDNCYTQNIDLLNLYKDKLMAIHLHDNNGIKDEHKIPGEGTINWVDVKNKILGTGYDKSITLEVTNNNFGGNTYKKPEIFLEVANQRLKKIFT